MITSSVGSNAKHKYNRKAGTTLTNERVFNTNTTQEIKTIFTIQNNEKRQYTINNSTKMLERQTNSSGFCFSIIYVIYSIFLN